MMTEAETQSKRTHLIGWAVFAGAGVGVIVLGLLITTIIERRAESRLLQPKVEIDRLETDVEQWAVNWPREAATYRQQQQTDTMTKYGGAYPRDYLEETPANVILFSGYGFAKDYLQARGHIHAIEDINATKRTGATTPATCWTCKSTDVPRKMAELGAKKLDNPEQAALAELVLAGAGDFYEHTWQELRDEITHPIGCLDCHEPGTMRLRISRPALIEAFQRQGRDLSQVSHQEMRSLVCAQCHVEYYFRGEGQYLTFPWDKGMTPEDMETYYDGYAFTDWTHAISGTPMVKMQHPDYEVYSTGIHAYRGVSCADCHMPYRSEGGAKFTDHHVRSPLLNVETSCQVCHRWSEDEIIARVTGTQDKTREARDRAERALARAHFDVAACMEAGAAEEELKPLRDLIRAAQLRWDYVAANNGMGFHSPAECLRILGDAATRAQECRVEAARVLARHGYTDPVQYPDYSSKEKAQELNRLYIAGNGPGLLLQRTAQAD